MKPWSKQEGFAKEIDIDSMAGTAAAFKRAAADARNIDDLATRATRVSQNSGSLNGSSLVNDIRNKKTFDSLRHGGNDMEKVVNHIFRGMKRAFDAEGNNRKHINWMNRQLAAHQAEAVAKWNGWSSALSRANQNVGNAEDPIVSVSYDGRRELLPRQGVPAWLADQIRESYLKRAVQDAGHTEKQIHDEINYYRHHMTWEASELAELGYELTEGPFKLFTTPQMARYAAKRLAEELRAEKPDPQRVEFYTSGLKSIAEGIYGDLTKPGAPAERKLSPAERAYLHEFFDSMTPEALTALGNLQGEGAIVNAKRNIADGISALLNPQNGGYSPSSGEVPDSIGNFVNYKHGERPGADFEMFNGFGEIMEQAKAMPSYELSQRLARSALDIEKLASQGDITMHFTGSSGMLSAASLNTQASANLLGDRSFTSNLLSQFWDDSQGAARLITSGATLPPGTEFTDKAAAPYVRAGFNVLQLAAQNPDPILGQLIGGGTAEHTQLQQAIGRTTYEYMDLLSLPAGKTSNPTGGSLWGNGQIPEINGQAYRHGFYLDMAERQKLFALMNDSEEPVRKNFFTAAAGWQYRTAHEAFTGRDSGLPNDLMHVGVIAGTIAHAQNSADTDDLQRRLGMYTAAKYAFDAAGTAPGNATAPVTWPFKTGFELLAADVQEEIDQKQATDIANLNTNGNLPGQLLVMAAADAANAPGLNNPENGRPGKGSDWVELQEYITGLKGTEYLTDFDEGYGMSISTATPIEQPDPRQSITPSPTVTRTP
ncbi:hypothetical protein ACHZ98_34100 [Streptomyces sp. MAR4 CNY-716]